MKSCIKQAAASVISGVILTVLVAWGFAVIYNQTYVLERDDIESIFNNGSHEWRVLHYNHVGVTRTVGACFPIEESKRNALVEFEPPKWSGLWKTYSFQKGFQYTGAYGWPMRALVWHGSLAHDNGMAESLSVDDGLVLVNDPSAEGIAARVIILPTVPIWLGIVINTAIYTPICWALGSVILCAWRARKRAMSDEVVAERAQQQDSSHTHSPFPSRLSHPC